MLPVIILTGFLGAGKTTVLQKMLSHEDYGDTAVLINEFGEIGIDQQLVGAIAPDVVLLDSGCLCCQIRGELKDSLVDLIDRRARGDIPAFQRIVIETTGLAEPTPIIATIQSDPMLAHQLKVAGTVTVVDAVNGEQMAANGHPVWMQQITAADLILITKSDIASESATRLYDRLGRLVPGIEIIRHGLDDALPDISAWMAQERGPLDAGEQIAEDQRINLDGEVQSLSLTTDQIIDWTAFGIWLSALLHLHGKSVLRLKGILNIGADTPVLVNGVQHMIYPPQHLPPGGPSARHSRLVIISTGIDISRLERSFRKLVLDRD